MKEDLPIDVRAPTTTYSWASIGLASLSKLGRPMVTRSLLSRVPAISCSAQSFTSVMSWVSDGASDSVGFKWLWSPSTSVDTSSGLPPRKTHAIVS